ncbi:MAG: helix-turn-helix transcriptional regulator [Alloprevotella tannerae]|nr:helix-turn-helix transcriptional regulator [Alloprevotella tannerae]
MSKSVYSDDYKKLIERLKQARLDAGLSQQVVAGKLGKPQSYVSKVESGERRVDIIEVKALAKVYKKSLEDFVE